MERIGLDTSAASAWEARSEGYVAGLGGAYHRHRLEVISALLPGLTSATVVDFGCGEGVLAARAFERGATRVLGLDINATLLSLARKNVPRGEFRAGGAGALCEIEPRSIDCIVAANVLAYCTDEEDATFYREAARMLRLGGSLVVTHSNALFDLFTLNAYTVDFFKDNFGADVTALITQPSRPVRTTFNIRENPLCFAHKLKRFGFREEQQEFINYHHVPPLMSTDNPDDMSRERPDTLGLAEQERWRLRFQCSMFGVRATLFG